MSTKAQENKIRVRNMLIIVLLSIGFGVAYNTVYYPPYFTEYLEAVTISILIGISLGMVEEFLLRKVFQEISFYKVLLIRTLLYSLLISLILSLVLSIEIAIDSQIPYTDAWISYLQSPLFRRDYFFSLTCVFIIIFGMQVVQLIGMNNLVRLVTGRYHQPREVKRVFMFIDLNDSTSMAERLGNQRYSSFIREYFNDLSYAINIYKGEIYQYVGDEVSVVWPARSKNGDHCLDCFFRIQEIINEKKNQYVEKFGDVPSFKAGAHVGTALLTEVGKLKKELVYHGDVVNTTSRIIGKCHELNQRFLVSDALMALVDSTHYEVVAKGEIALKGKTRKVNLYGINQPESTRVAHQ